MEFLLHIGMPKTGSKALQGFLAANPRLLQKNGLRFAESFRQQVWHRSLFEHSGGPVSDAILPEAECGQALIFSYEAGYRVASDAVIDELAALATARLVMFVRHPVDWLNSFFNQMIKAHRIGFEEIGTFSVNSENLNAFLDIETYLVRWTARFGEDSLRLIPYTHSTDVCRAFLDWAGVQIDSANVRSSAGENQNQAADETSLRVLLEIKRRMSGRKETELVKAISVAHQTLRANWIDTRTERNLLFLSDEEQAAIDQRYRESYDRLLRQYGASSYAALIDESTTRTRMDRRTLANCTAGEQKTVSAILEKAGFEG